MLKTENRPRPRSTSMVGAEKCQHPSLRPLDLAEAENILRHQPLKEVHDEYEEAEREFLKPKCPSGEKSLALHKLTNKFLLTDAHLLHIEKRMLDEVNRGLGKSTNRSANVKSFITYITNLPSGREKGEFLALDLGGTNFRVIHVQLQSRNRSIKMKSDKFQVSESLMLGPGEDLFNFMADRLIEFLRPRGLLGKHYSLGFTFSFPTCQHSINRATLACWTKGYACSGVEGQDVTALLQAAIARHPELDISVDAIVNDTTGCLLACAYKRSDAYVGVIVGTGTNASYVEEIGLAELFEGTPPRTTRSVVINTEWGAFGNTGSLDIIRTRYDHDLDDRSINPGKQVYEKMISGMYLGELARLVIEDAVSKGIIFGGKEYPELMRKNGFPTKYISDIEADVNRDTFDNIQQVFSELGITEATNFDYRAVRYICECVSYRAACLAGAGVASLINKVGKRIVTVGMDGSLYKFHPHFHNRMDAAVRRLVCDCILFEMVLSEDGSGRGAALAAACAAKQKIA